MELVNDDFQEENKNEESAKDIFNNMRIGTRITIIICLVMAIVVGITFAYTIITTRNNEIVSAKENAIVLVSDNATTAKGMLEETYIDVSQHAKIFSEYKLFDNNERRKIFSNMLKTSLEENEEYLSTWTVWETNKLDGLDSSYRNSAGHDHTGRFLSHWSRSSGEIQLESLDDYNTSDYFILAKESKEPVILDPYIYEFDSKEVLITTIAMPIFDGKNEVVAVVGVDIALEALSVLEFNKGAFDSSYFFVLANDGTFVTHDRGNVVGTNILDIDDDYNQKVIDAISLNNSYSFEDRSVGTGFMSFKAIEPFKIGDIKTPWGLGLVVDMNEMTAGAQVLTISYIIALLVLIGIISASVFMVSKKMITEPVTMLKDIAEKLAVGDVDVEIGEAKNDEIGLLMQSFGRMIENTQEQVAASEKIAAGYLDVDIMPKSENDILSISLKTVANKLSDLVKEADLSVANAVRGKLDVRGDVSNFEGGYKDLIKGINELSDSLVGHLDSIPVPAMIIDTNYTVQYMNKAAGRMLEEEPEKILGNKCYNFFKTGDCNTENCASRIAMEKGTAMVAQTEATPHEKTLNVEYTSVPIRDRENKIIGALEIVIDQTEIMDAHRISEKQANYQAMEVEKLMASLGELAQGNLQVEYNVAEADQDTLEMRDNFENISVSLSNTTKVINEYIGEMTNTLDSMANNDFNVEVNREFLGDFNQMKISLNHIIEQFNIVLREIKVTAEQVGAGAQEVSDSSQSLSQGSTEQASSVEEISASITEVAEQTKQNAMNANRANEVSSKARSFADQGNAHMQEMLEAMHDINESSGNISKIIKVIDDIAFQTNILALNAAVEAARAGEHGRGFAVVAEEVRSLAAKSAEAARDTTELIDESIKRTQGGTEIANLTAKALEEIVEGAAEAVELVEGISNASNEQASAIAQINDGINQVSAVTQSNTATAEESASASEQMASQAEMLNSLIEQFRIKEDINIREDIQSEEKVFRIKTKPSEKISKQKEQKLEIKLDDSEFGKY